jgi:DNA-binding GntR family transcriptional regulator
VTPAPGAAPMQRPRTITEIVAGALRDEIRSGVLAPGSRLRQVEVAQRFDVSTTPVREAFAALEREGLLVSSSHRGVVVFHPSVHDLGELYEIRIPLEALATEKAVANITDEDLITLQGLLAEMAASTDRRPHYQELNRVFHATIYAAAKRPKLEKLIMDMRDASTAYLRLYATISPTAQDTQREHEAIFAAIKARAPKRAAREMKAHLQHTVEFVSAGLRQEPADAAA